MKMRHYSKLALSFFFVTSVTMIRGATGFNKSAHSRHSNFVANKILYEVQAHQIMNFRNGNSSDVRAEENELYEKLANQVPIYDVDILDRDDGKDDKLQNVPGLFNARDSFLFFVECKEVYSGSCLSFFMNVINFFNFIVPLGITPRCLIIVYTRWRSETQDTFERVLYKAWYGSYFLDFTLLFIDERRKYPIIMHLNPFFEYTKLKYLTLGEEIFPDKLADVNGYPFKLFISQEETGSTIYKKDDNGKITFIYSHRRLFHSFFKKYNFTQDFVICEDLPSECIRQAFKKLWRRQVSAFPMDIGVTKVQMRYLPSESMRLITEYVYVPNEKMALVVYPFYMVVSYAIQFVVIITMFWMLTRFAEQVTTRRWLLGQILESLAGVSFNGPQESFSEKLIIVLLSIISMTFTNDFLGTFIDFEINYKPLAYDSLADVVNSPLAAYGGEALFDWAKQSDGVFWDLRKKVKPFDPYNGMENVPRPPFIFMGDKQKASKINQWIMETKRSKSLRPTDLSVVSVSACIFFEVSSPFVDKFHYLHGLYAERFVDLEPEEIDVSENNSDDFTADIIRNILILGIGIATLVFVGEIIKEHLDRNKVRKSKRQAERMRAWRHILV